MDFNEIKEKSRKRFQITALETRIKQLKSQLADEDYKVIKCMESYLIDKDAPLPYDIDTMVKERNVIRTEINECEAQIAELKLED